MDALTIGDADYFETISLSASQLQEHHPDATLYVYDWGFADQQVASLGKHTNVTVVDWGRPDYIPPPRKHAFMLAENLLRSNRVTDWVLSGLLDYTHPKGTRWENDFLYTQKPLCIRDASFRADGGLVYLDGDAFLVNRLDVFDQDFDIGVTLRPHEEIKAAQNRGDYHVLNAGVIFFNCENIRINGFVNYWFGEIGRSDPPLREQTSLSKLVETAAPDIYDGYYNTGSIEIDSDEFVVKVFPCEEYNYNWVERGFNSEENRVLHLKSGRFDRTGLDNILAQDRAG